VRGAAAAALGTRASEQSRKAEPAKNGPPLRHGRDSRRRQGMGCGEGVLAAARGPREMAAGGMAFQPSVLPGFQPKRVQSQ